MPKNYYFLRLLARGMDGLLVFLVLFILNDVLDFSLLNFLSAYLLYNTLMILLGGESFGKYLFSLELQTTRHGGRKRLILLCREILVWFLLPVILGNLLMLSPRPLHDALVNTRVIRK